ncbi:MAG: GNAT family N-acetyltransferase [Saprospiraceae bacterium]
MKNFRLRHWQPSDAESLVKYANNANIARYMRDAFPHPYTKADGDNFIQFAMQKLPASIFAITVDDLAIGGIGLHPQNDIYRLNAELGYWLGEPFWGQGIITNAISQIVTYGFENLQIERIYAIPFGSNIGSQKVLEKAGFLLEAKLSKTIVKNNVLEDELIYAIRKVGS